MSRIPRFPSICSHKGVPHQNTNDEMRRGAVATAGSVSSSVCVCVRVYGCARASVCSCRMRLREFPGVFIVLFRAPSARETETKKAQVQRALVFAIVFDYLYKCLDGVSPYNKQFQQILILIVDRGGCPALTYYKVGRLIPTSYLPSKGLLCSKKIPDTVLFGAEIGEFGAEGIKITPVVPMQKWTVSYKGQMWYQNDPTKLVEVDFFGEWNATSKHFDFDSDLYPPAVIKSIALEKWSREYFEKLKTAHQSHYEQFGTLKCKFKIENESFEYTLPSFRDHSFGRKRDWTLMHRYAFHHIFLENGISISVGVICQPSTASVFEAGTIAFPDGEVLPIKWVDLKLYQHGENGQAPRDYAFKFQAGDEEYTVQVLVEYESVHYVSSDWDARMVERFCKFVVNNVPGRGVSEFHYRHKDGRPESVAKNDLEWYRKMCHKV